LYLDNLTINDLLDIELPVNVSNIILKSGTYKLTELKNLIAIQKKKSFIK